MNIWFLSNSVFLNVTFVLFYRKIMDSGELDFYQHSRLCSNTCRSTKIDPVGARVSLSSQPSTETGPATPASVDGTNQAHKSRANKIYRERSHSMKVMFNRYILFHLKLYLIISVVCSEWIHSCVFHRRSWGYHRMGHVRRWVSAPRNFTLDILKRPCCWSESFCFMSEDTVTIWRGLKDAGLLDEVMGELEREMQEILKGLEERIQDPPLQANGQTPLNLFTISLINFSPYIFSNVLLFV